MPLSLIPDSLICHIYKFTDGDLRTAIKFLESKRTQCKGGALMKTVRCEAAEAVFSFSLEDVVEVLKSRDPDDEAKQLMDFLTAQSQDVIEIPQEKKSFLFAVLHLLASDKGSVFCKVCGVEYQASELVSFPVGAGDNPLKVKMGYQESLLKRILGRGKRMPLFGGKGYRCPEGHALIAAVTWRT
jgi:hypothetical protein